MKSLSMFFLATLIVYGCGPQKNKEGGEDGSQMEDTTSLEETEPQLSMKWETDTIYETPESVLFDELSGMIYVSNIAGKPTEDDGNGYISMLTTDGKVKEQKWAEGLSAPKGMAISNGKLFVTDISNFVVIDLESGDIVEEYPIQEAQFLNDVAASPEGKIYFSDMNTGKIYVYNEGNIELFIEGQEKVNGLLVKDNHLYAATGAGFKVIDMSDKSVEMVSEQVAGGDGIVALNNEDFVVSRWVGEIYYVAQDGKTTKMLDSKDEKMNTADIGIIPSENLILVPTFFRHKIVASEVTP